jgi:hypothetical protein
MSYCLKGASSMLPLVPLNIFPFSLFHRCSTSSRAIPYMANVLPLNDAPKTLAWSPGQEARVGAGPIWHRTTIRLWARGCSRHHRCTGTWSGVGAGATQRHETARQRASASMRRCRQRPRLQTVAGVTQPRETTQRRACVRLRRRREGPWPSHQILGHTNQGERRWPQIPQLSPPRAPPASNPLAWLRKPEPQGPRR